MKIKLTSVFVDDQDKALNFYTQVLGFEKKTEMQAGDFKWLTVASREEKEGTELVLEPNENPVARAYQRGIYEQGIPAASFGVEDIEKEYELLKRSGVEFSMKPTQAEGPMVAVFDDTCGNLIQLFQM